MLATFSPRKQERAKDIYVADAKVIALDEDAADVDAVLSIDLAAGGGIAPGPEQVYKLVQLSQATVICRIDDVLTVRYGEQPGRRQGAIAVGGGPMRGGGICDLTGQRGCPWPAG